MKDFTTPASGSQLNDRAYHVIRVMDAVVFLIRMSRASSTGLVMPTPITDDPKFREHAKSRFL